MDATTSLSREGDDVRGPAPGTRRPAVPDGDEFRAALDDPDARRAIPLVPQGLFRRPHRRIVVGVEKGIGGAENHGSIGEPEQGVELRAVAGILKVPPIVLDGEGEHRDERPPRPIENGPGDDPVGPAGKAGENRPAPPCSSFQAEEESPRRLFDGRGVRKLAVTGDAENVLDQRNPSTSAGGTSSAARTRSAS